MARSYEQVLRDMREIFGEDDEITDVTSTDPQSDHDLNGLNLSSGTNKEGFTGSSESEFSSETETTLEEDSVRIESTSQEEEWTNHRVHTQQMPTPPTPVLRISDATNKTPLDYFLVLFNDIFLKYLVSCINCHGNIVKGKANSDQSRVKKWSDTNKTELLTFLGILFFMGSVPLKKINDYWRKTHLVQFFLGQYMSRNRFLLILRMLYFTTLDVAGNIYSAVDPLIHTFNNAMKDIVYPTKQLVIDESMVLFRWRLGIRQYIKNKRHKHGIKLYVLADPEGLVHRVHMYRGKSDKEVGGKGHVNKVVLRLLNDYLNAGHSVYMDNFYNSIDLTEELLLKKTYCTGTLQSNRKNNPVVVTGKKLSRGGKINRYNKKGICILKWKDKRDVLTISSEHSHEAQVTVNRRGVEVEKPNIVLQYNKFMKGVDRHDQMLSYYTCEHKSIRWFKKIGIHILQMMFTNAYFLYRRGTGKTITLQVFREKVLFGILPPPVSDYQEPTFATHMPIELIRTDGGVIKRRRCVRCQNLYKKRKDTTILCPDCDVGLCLSCYKSYHIEKGLLVKNIA